MIQLTSWMDTYAVVDCAAAMFSRHRPDAGQRPEDSNLRKFFRAQPVKVLRLVWRDGDRSERATVAARVLVWLDKDQERVKRVSGRVQ
jgi:hypothetical protein